MGQADVLAASVDSGRMQDADDKERERRMGKEDQPDLEQQTSRARRLGLLLAAARGRAGDRLSHPGGVAVHGLLLENVDSTVTVSWMPPGMVLERVGNRERPTRLSI